MSGVRQINLSDDELFARLFEAIGHGDSFMKPLIRAHIMAHREGDVEATEWIRKSLGWDS